ncbi:MAG: right-handed parallel beta-helix repeat-containing protein, partial [Methanosphaera sp.]|nr:right-handed parallel beta-helix repeat-containing protein [Methanosphaera sp.]
MKLKNKKLMLTLLLFIFISSITVVSAVDVSDNVTSTDYQVSTVETISVDEQPVDEYNNIESNVNEAKEISKDKPVKSLNGVTHTINSESYSTYFTNGILNNAAQDGDVILIDDIFEGSSFIFDKSINLTSTQNAILRNCIITFNSNADYSNVTNLNIVNIDDNAHDGINVYSATNMTIEDNTIYIDSNNTAKGITLNNADGTIIYNNDITVNAYTNNVTYYYEDNYFNPAGTVETAGIGVYNSSYTNVESNTVSMSSTGHSAERDTLVGIAVQGNIVDNSSLPLYPVEIDYNTIKNNIVNLDGNLYAYGITVQYYALHNTIINNTITADSSTKFYVCGIQLSYLVQYNQIYDNKINLTALNFTYGINTQGIPGYNGYNDFYNNRINLSSIYTRGIESYIGYYDKIRYNVILVNGDYSNGIGLGGILGNNITYNVINSTGTIFTVNKYIYEEIPYKTDGIYVDSARYYDQNGDVQTSLAVYNNIKFNYILTNGVYAIDLHAYFNNITNNYINSSSRYGNNAVNKNGNGSNTCNYNRAYINPYFLNNRLLLKSNKLQSTMLKSSGLEDNGATTHVITNDNWRTFFTNEVETTENPLFTPSYSLTLNSSLVSDNDVLDFQGEIIIDQDILIDIPVNITSTTNDGKISPSNKSDLNVFEINNKGSHSNVTNICLHDIQFILKGADYININHINVSTENCSGLGWGKGVTSIREGCDYINITNSIFRVYNNGGSSNLVLCGAGFVNIDNNTIHSEYGNVGNVVYLNPYNVDNATNQYINITNNNITGPTDPAAICWLVALNVG